MNGVPHGEERVLAEMGIALLVIQNVEWLLRFTLRYPLSGAEGVTIETLERSESELRKKTLGNFLALLRQRVSVDDAFGGALDHFLNARNMFVHRVEEVPGWNLHSTEGRAAAHTFLRGLIQTGTVIAKLLTALSRDWAEQNNFAVEIPDGSEALFTEIDATFKPLVQAVFSKKE